MLRPPRIAEALISITLPRGGVRESVLGDLHELFLARTQEPGGSLGRARRWYWKQLVVIGPGYVARRVTGTRYRSFAPTGRPAEAGRRGGYGMGALLRQVRLSLRALARSPGFTVPALAMLAIGMSAATAIFTVVDSVVFRPLDMPDSDRVVIVCEDHARMAGACVASPSNVDDLRRSTSTLTELGIGRGWPFTVADDRGSDGVRGGLASAGFLRAVGATTAAGRIFRDEEFGPDDDDVALLSHAFWVSRYGADPSVVGSTILLSGEPVQIVGVLAEGFDLPLDLGGIEVWRPPHVDVLAPETREWRGFRAIGRMADGVSLASASSELTAAYAGIAREHEAVNDEWRLRVQSLLRVVVGDTQPVLLAFLAAAGLLLLIVCANVSNLLLARGLGRRQELAVRAALGAGRRRLVTEIFVEGLVLSGLAAAIAVALSGSGVQLLLAMAPPGIPRLDEVVMDGRVLLFTIGVSAAATVLFATLPALRATAWELGQSLKGGARSGEAAESTMLQNSLVIAELALSVVLLTSAALLTRSFLQYMQWDGGFEQESLVAVSAFFDPGTYGTRADFVPVIRQGEELIGGLPGVESVATASAGPLFGGGDGATPIASDGADLSAALPTARWYDIGPGYFRTLGLPMVSGRELEESDTEETPRVAVVNEAFVRRVFAGDDAIGRRVRLPEVADLEFDIVGVVADVPPMVPGEATYPEIYWSNRQLGRIATFYLVRARADAGSIVGEVAGALERADPDVSMGTPFTLASQAERELVRPRFQATILVTFALAALLLSAVGVYAVVSYAVARRTREVGIRVALGARRSDVVALLGRSSIAVVMAGVAIGLAGAAAVGPFLRAIVPGVSPLDPVSLGAGSLVLLFAACLAVLGPARRATRIDPLKAMRAE